MSCLQTQAHWSRKFLFSCISRSNLQAGALITLSILLQGPSKHSLWRIRISYGTVVAHPGQVWACSWLERDPPPLLWQKVWGRKLPPCAEWGTCHSIVASMQGPCRMPCLKGSTQQAGCKLTDHKPLNLDKKMEHIGWQTWAPAVSDKWTQTLQLCATYLNLLGPLQWQN